MRDDRSRAMDTSPEAHAAHVEALRRMGPGERVRLAFQMSNDVRRISEDGVRHRHPEYDDRMVERAVAAVYLGPELAAAMWPDEASPRP